MHVSERRDIGNDVPSTIVDDYIDVVARRLHGEGWTALRRRNRLVARWSAGARWARLDVRVETAADRHPADHRAGTDLLLEFRCSDRDPATLSAVHQVLRALEQPES